MVVLVLSEKMLSLVVLVESVCNRQFQAHQRTTQAVEAGQRLGRVATVAAVQQERQAELLAAQTQAAAAAELAVLILVESVGLGS